MKASWWVRRCSAGLASDGRISARWTLAWGYSLSLNHTAAIPSQSSGVAQALENTPSLATAVYMRRIIGRQDLALHYVPATHRRRAHKVVE